MNKLFAVLFVLGASTLQAQDRSDQTVLSNWYRIVLLPQVTFHGIGSGLRPNAIITVHRRGGPGDYQHMPSGGFFVQFHTDSNGIITDPIQGPTAISGAIGNACTQATNPVNPYCTGEVPGWSGTEGEENRIAAFADDGFDRLPASGGRGITWERRVMPEGTVEPGTTDNPITFDYVIGNAPPDENQTKTCDLQVGCTDCSKGMANYSIHLMLASLHIEDTPITYNSPRGPSTDFKVVYNQREALPSTFDFSNLGPKWTFNWLSYVTDNGPTEKPTVYVRGGGTEVFDGYNTTTQSYAPDRQTLAVLVRNTDGSFEKQFPDGSKEVFAKSYGSNPRRVFLTRVVDSTGVNSTTLTYDIDGTPRITQITDSLGHPTTLIYDSSDTYQIKEVHDPFGRVAMFCYTSGKLTKITDPIGIESRFEYDGSSDFIKTMITPYGMTGFLKEASGSSVRWIEVTDPRLGRERVEYNSSVADIPSSETSVPPGVYNSDLQLRNTFYWDKKAMTEYTPGDHTNAQLFHWLLGPGGKVSGIKHSEKKALESRIWYIYPGQAGVAQVGSLASPTKMVRLLDDGTPQISQYSYNPLGRLLTETDPVGRVKRYVYDTNSIDLLRVYQRNPIGQSTDPAGNAEDEIAVYTYNPLQTLPPHRPITVKDAAEQTTINVYNSNGQILTTENAKHEITTYVYGDGTTVPVGYLASIASPTQANGSRVATIFTYDGANRVHTVMNDPDGYIVTTEYDYLDRPTQVTYPDGTTQKFEYTQVFQVGEPPRKILDMTRSKDRLDRWTTRHYNGNRQMDSITDPAYLTTQYDWCTCGSLASITDPNGDGHTTTFIRDLQSRVSSKVFADGSAINYFYENGTSRLASMTDALNQTTIYHYYADDSLSQVSYANAQKPTPPIYYVYDDSYNRIKSVTKTGMNAINYTYYPVTTAATLGANQLKTVGGVFANDTITYTYDQLGRVLGQSINGVAETAEYDPLGRIFMTNNDALGPFVFTYEGLTSRLQTVSYPNGQTTNYTYFGNTGDRRLHTLQNLAGTANLSQFGFEYDPEGQIASWTKLLDTTQSGLWFEHDYAKRLRSARNALDLYIATKKWDYDYDNAGNRTYDRNYNPNGSGSNGLSHSYAINSLNQVEAGTEGGAAASPDPQVFVYDAVGNLTGDSAGKSYEWDAANRLVAINYISTGKRTEFGYDGLGRRVKITEYGPGITAEIEPEDVNYDVFSTGKMSLPAGLWTLTLQGLNPNGGDNTMLLDSVTLTGVSLANNSFETPSVQDYQVAPTAAGTAWSFSGTAGVAANGGTYTSDNPDTTDGHQVAFVRNYGSLSTGFFLPAGRYKLNFNAAQRGSGNDSSQRLRVTFRSSASVISAKTFVWCGDKICEERDGTGANVIKRFYAQGEQHQIEAGAPENYYYTRDHLGSIREVTDANGALRARYDYDPYGNRVVLSGNMNTDFGYTGHYFHQPSGFNLTPYRAYNSVLGRWISRDPIGEKGGLNLYAYVSNDPIDKIDPLGLIDQPGIFRYEEPSHPNIPLNRYNCGGYALHRTKGEDQRSPDRAGCRRVNCFEQCKSDLGESCSGSKSEYKVILLWDSDNYADSWHFYRQDGGGYSCKYGVSGFGFGTNPIGDYWKAYPPEGRVMKLCWCCPTP